MATGSFIEPERSTEVYLRAGKNGHPQVILRVAVERSDVRALYFFAAFPALMPRMRWSCSLSGLVPAKSSNAFAACLIR